jgi:glutathione S-transferase
MARRRYHCNLESRRLGKVLGVIGAHLQDRSDLPKRGFSAVDTRVGYGMHLAGKFIPLDPYPRVVEYYARLRERPAFRAALPNAAAG